MQRNTQHKYTVSNDKTEDGRVFPALRVEVEVGQTPNATPLKDGRAEQDENCEQMICDVSQAVATLVNREKKYKMLNKENNSLSLLS